MNNIIKKLFERTSTRKYIRNISKTDIEIFINNNNTKDNEDKNKKINKS